MSLPPPAIPTQNNLDLDELHKALGKGLTQWQHVESGLFLLALPLMGTDLKTCFLAFLQIKSAENKLAFVDRLIFHKLEQKVRSAFWNPIRKEIREAIDFRNSLAHFESFYLTDDEFKNINPPTNYRVAISHHHLDEHSRKGGIYKLLTVEIVNQNAEQLRLTNYRIMYFIVDHVPHTELLIKSLPPRLQQFLDSFRKKTRLPGFEPPPQSSR